MKIDREKLDEIIESSKYISDDSGELNSAFRSLLRKMTESLCNYTESVMESIDEKVSKSSNSTEISSIFSTVSNPEKKMIGMSEMKIFPAEKQKKNNGEESGGSYFLDADYNTIREITGDSGKEAPVYKGEYLLDDKQLQSFEYTLKFDDSFLQMQELLCRLSGIYKISNPIIYSPYIRKAVKPVYKIPEKAKPFFKFEQNNLPVKEGVSVFWNLEARYSELKPADSKQPYGDETRYVYRFPQEDSKHVYAVPESSQVIIFDVSVRENETVLTIDREMESFILFKYTVIDEESKEVKTARHDRNFFSNALEKTDLKNPRIISEADIELAINPFRNADGMTCEIVENVDKEKVCIRYSSKYRHHSANRAGYKKIKRVHLKFSAKEEEKFFEDYINYVLEYLDHYYSEIEWVGVC